MIKKLKALGSMMLYGTELTLFMYLAAIIWNHLGIRLNTFTGFVWYAAVITIGLYVTIAIDAFVYFIEGRLKTRKLNKATGVKK